MSIRYVCFQTRCLVSGPRHHLAPTGRASARSRSMPGSRSIARTIRLLSRGRPEREVPHVGKPSLVMHAAVGARPRSWVRPGRHRSVRWSRSCLPRSTPRGLSGGPAAPASRAEHRGRGGRTPAVSGTESTWARSAVAPDRVRLLEAPWRWSCPRHRSRASAAPLGS